MASGDFKHTIIIAKLVDDKTPQGDEVKTLIDVFKARSNVKVLSGSELLKSGLALTREYASIKMRFDVRLNHEYFIIYEGYTYEISSIRPDDKKLNVIVTVARDIF